MSREKKKSGFTIVELLTVMSVIAVLIGLLVPALNLVRRMATDTKQRAQFHSINVALEFFSGENDGYPESDVEPSPTSTSCTVGAQHLAEALVGRDLLGYDTLSTGDAAADASQNIYVDTNDCLDRRRGPYLNSENVEAYQVEQLYGKGNTGNVYDGNATPAPVIADAYRVKFVTTTVGSGATAVSKQVKAGSPVLYYRANTASRIFDYTKPAASIFNIDDNEELVALGKVIDTSIPHPILKGTAGTVKFYDMITNPKITNMPRPYNQNTYILISAGFDGLYGTRDDITNFGE